MTDYGFQVQNNNSIVVVDSTYKNHVYHSHGTASVNQYLTEIDIDDITGSAMLFIKPPTDYAYPQGFVKNGSVYDKIVIASNSAQNVEWIVYEEISSVPSGGYGLNVYDSTSNIVFSSNVTGYLNIESEYAYTTIGSNLTVSDTVNNYFTIMGNNIGYVANFTTGILTRDLRGFKKVDSTTINTALFTYYSGNDLTISSGSISGSANNTPQWFIEIKAPPSL
jgi:hypothetical protein